MVFLAAVVVVLVAVVLAPVVLAVVVFAVAVVFLAVVDLVAVVFEVLVFAVVVFAADVFAAVAVFAVVVFLAVEVVFLAVVFLLGFLITVGWLAAVGAGEDSEEGVMPPPNKPENRLPRPPLEEELPLDAALLDEEAPNRLLKAPRGLLLPEAKPPPSNPPSRLARPLLFPLALPPSRLCSRGAAAARMLRMVFKFRPVLFDTALAVS